MRYEYDTVFVTDPRQHPLDSWGAEGWEAYGVVPGNDDGLVGYWVWLRRPVAT